MQDLEKREETAPNDAVETPEELSAAPQGESTEENAGQASEDGRRKRSRVILALAGLYLVYIGYKLCKDTITGEEGSAWYFMLAGVIFIVIGGFALFRGGKEMAQKDKERRLEAAKQAEEQKIERAAAPGGKKSISDRANLVKNLEEEETAQEAADEENTQE